MLGISPYETRNELLHRYALGITKEIDQATQRRFDEGHRFEALARPLAEKIIGEELFPVVASEGKLSASYDGLVIDEARGFEHKRLNAEIRRVFANNEPLLEYHRCQMEQQLMIPENCNAILFMATEWDENDQLIGEPLHRWYTSDQTMRERIMHGWTQFSIDLENYKPQEYIPAPVATPIRDLPAITYRLNGLALTTNLRTDVKPEVLALVETAKKKPETDQDFADLDAMCKKLRQVEERCKIVEGQALGEISDVDTFVRDLRELGEISRKAAIAGENSIKGEKENRKNALIQTAKFAFAQHVAALEDTTLPIKLVIQIPDFAGAIKGMKKLDAMKEEIETVLRNGKFDADALAKDIRAKLVWYNDMTSIENGLFGFLFPDLQQISVKPLEDFKLTVTSRIEAHKKIEAEKLERILAEEQAKAQAATAPSAEELIEFVAQNYGVGFDTACNWIIETAERMRVAA